MYRATASITSKGQITLPKKMRDIIRTNTVSIEINDSQQVIISPINDLAGSLSEYKNSEDLSFEEIRKQSWEETIKNSQEGK